MTGKTKQHDKDIDLEDDEVLLDKQSYYIGLMRVKAVATKKHRQIKFK